MYFFLKIKLMIEISLDLVALQERNTKAFYLLIRIPIHHPCNGFGLYAIYGAGLFAMAGILFLLYLRAFSQRNLLKLNQFEIDETKSKFILLGIVSFTGFVAAILALILSETLASWSALTSLAIPVSAIFINRFYKKRLIFHFVI
jgi:hypothetical protein